MTDAPPRPIASIPTDSVRRLCAGQAILDLSSCVKELVDNAIDAGSKSINIRLFRKGLDIVEVSDDGTGVPFESRDALALPHSTSKIRDVSEIGHNTLGFRGEALHSLAHVSQRLVIATRCSHEVAAEQLEFDSSTGAVASRKALARKVGTTVAVVGLLSRLPVRRRDLEQRIKVHKAQVLQMVSQYAILYTGVAVQLMEMQPQTTTILSTPSNATTMTQTMAVVWGPDQHAGMVPFNLEVPDLVQIEGFVGSGNAKPVTGIHKRPVDWPALGRAIRDGWKLVDTGATSVTWVVNAKLTTGTCDVNLSPDKRQVMVEKEAAICQAVGKAVSELSPPLRRKRRFAFVHTPATSVAKEKEHDELLRKVQKNQQVDFSSEHQEETKCATDEPAMDNESSDGTSSDVHESEKITTKKQKVSKHTPTITDDTLGESTSPMTSTEVATATPPNTTFSEPWREKLQWREAKERFNQTQDELIKTLATVGLERFGFRSTLRKDRPQRRTVSISAQDSVPDRPPRKGMMKRQASVVLKSPTESEESATQDSPPKTTPQQVSIPPTPTTSPEVWSSFRDTASTLQAYSHERRGMRERQATQNTASQDSADGNTRLSKEELGTMEILGQFNMGFIVARTVEGSVWILDQHGCDEKFNFERLCEETVIHEQPLISPLPLELSAMQEACIRDHMPIFEKNGFRFAYDSSGPPRFRFSLTALPHSGAQDGRKAVQFGKDDVIALCALLSGEEVDDGGTGTDGSGLYGNNAVRRYATQSTMGEDAEKIMARLPKAIAMFASRACRNSIMIGTALSKKEMEKIAHRLAHVESPWNCPHGRPTLCRLGDFGRGMWEEDS